MTDAPRAVDAAKHRITLDQMAVWMSIANRTKGTPLSNAVLAMHDEIIDMQLDELANIRTAREPKLPYYGDSPNHFCPAHKMVYSECLDQHEPPTEFVFAAREPALTELLAAAREWRDVIGGKLTVPPQAYLDAECRLASAVDALAAMG